MKKNINIIKNIGTLILASSFITSVYAGDFYTIIGPDGRPMVIPKKTDETKKAKPNESQQSPKKEVKDQPQALPNTSRPITNNSKNGEVKQAEISKSVEEKKRDEVLTNPKPVVINQPKYRDIERQQNVVPQVNQNVEVQTNQQPIQKSESTQSSNNIEKSIPLTKATESEKANPLEQSTSQNKTLENTQNPSKQTSATQSALSAGASKFTEIDGVKYVDNEYLEDKEFNLEGRKRFYIMPDSSVAGPRRFEAVEREKGVTKSVLSKFLNSAKPEDEKPIVLAPTYYRLPKQDVVASLEQACFADKKLEKAKSLSLKNEEMGIWPMKPLKEKFVYEIVKLDPAIQNIQFSSYTSSQKNPTYYWPLVVFLDQQGCVLEGVSGFKNENKNDSNFQHAALEGVLKKPDQAFYLFMTPLAESIDVKEYQLSNQGQIKLSVLR